jgi:hypothetical protein
VLCFPSSFNNVLSHQEDPAKALTDAERLKRQRMEEEESERSQRMLMEQVRGVVGVQCCGTPTAGRSSTAQHLVREGASQVQAHAAPRSTTRQRHMLALPACARVRVQVARARKTARLDDSADGQPMDSELKRSEADEPITLSLAAAAAAKAAAAAADKQHPRPAAAAPPLFGDDEGETLLRRVARPAAPVLCHGLLLCYVSCI